MLLVFFSNDNIKGFFITVCKIKIMYYNNLILLSFAVQLCTEIAYT